MIAPFERALFNPGEVAEALEDATAFEVFNAYLVTGGYPRLVEGLARAGSLDGYMEHGLADENSDVVIVGQRALDAEFPVGAQARRVLSAIGNQEVGHATFSSVFAELGGGDSSKTAISRSLKVLGDQKGVVRVENTAGRAASTKLRRYRITDPYLRFWLRYVEPHLANIARGRSDLAINGFTRDWPSWRGRAIEPEVRAALDRLAPGDPVLRPATDVGGWWNRDNSIEVDLAATNRRKVLALGSIKWRLRRQMTRDEIATLAAAPDRIPVPALRRCWLSVPPAASRPPRCSATTPPRTCSPLGVDEIGAMAPARRSRK